MTAEQMVRWTELEQLVLALEHMDELWRVECDDPTGRFEDCPIFHTVFSEGGLLSNLTRIDG